MQCRLRIGYDRDAHLIDLMEHGGLAGPADGSRPRELLKAPGWLCDISVGDEYGGDSIETVPDFRSFAVGSLSGGLS